MRKFDEAVGYYLNKGQFVAISPEQAMWEMYDKPRPFKIGAFHYAVKYDVPVLPIFITFRPSGTYDAEGNEIKYFTVNIMPPLYANKELNPKEQAKDLMNRNYQACVDKYEEVYGKKLHPELGCLPPERVALLHIDAFHDGHDDGEAQGERHKNPMVTRRERELQSGPVG